MTGSQRLAIAVSLVYLALLAPLTLTTAGASTLEPDVEVMREVQEVHGTFGGWIAEYGNWIGSTVGGLVVGVFVAVWLLRHAYWLESLLVIGVVLLRAANAVLKAFSDSPRPQEIPGVVRVTEQASGAGFPSGHAMGSVLLWGGLAIVAFRLSCCPRMRTLVVVAAALSVLATGFARVYVGAHWPSDVVGGVMWGLALIALIAFALQQASERWPRLRPTPIVAA